eukprot:scaffold192649_cov17-Tisochrysis_lutea.AAC.1
MFNHQGHRQWAGVSEAGVLDFLRKEATAPVFALPVSCFLRLNGHCNCSETKLVPQQCVCEDKFLSSVYAGKESEQALK